MDAHTIKEGPDIEMNPLFGLKILRIPPAHMHINATSKLIHTQVVDKYVQYFSLYLLYSYLNVGMLKSIQTRKR